MLKHQQTRNEELAHQFLLNRNRMVLNDYMSDQEYAMALMDFEDIHGPESLEGLAGLYIFAINNKKGEEQIRMITNAFAHDIGGRRDVCMLPKSSGYVEVWREEVKRRGWT